MMEKKKSYICMLSSRVAVLEGKLEMGKWNGRDGAINLDLLFT